MRRIKCFVAVNGLHWGCTKGESKPINNKGFFSHVCMPSRNDDMHEQGCRNPLNQELWIETGEDGSRVTAEGVHT